MDAAPNLRRPRALARRALVIPLMLVGTAVALWLGAASFVTYHLMHPPFLDQPRGDVFVGSENARAAALLGLDPRADFAADYEDLRISYEGGASVNGWMIPASGNFAVILLPAAGASRRSMLPYLKFLHTANYPVLMIDSPDYRTGRSGWGWRGREVINSAVALLKQRGFSKIALLGVSEGGASALFARAEGAQLDAIIADSAYANLGSMLRRNPSLGGLNPAFLSTVMFELGLALGRDPDRIAPANATSKLGGCTLMVIQNRGDPITPASDGPAIDSHASSTARKLWIAPTNGHGDAIYEAPDDYRARVLGFLARNANASAVAPK